MQIVYGDHDSVVLQISADGSGRQARTRRSSSMRVSDWLTQRFVFLKNVIFADTLRAAVLLLALSECHTDSSSQARIVNTVL